MGCSKRNTAPSEGELISEPVQTEIISAAFSEEDLPEEQIVTNHSTARFAIFPASAQPGDPVTVGYNDNFAGTGLQAVLLDSRGRRLSRATFFSLPDEDPAVSGGIKVAVLAIPSTAIFGNAIIRVESGDSLIRDLPFTIESREFHSETVHLNQENTDLRTVPDPQKTAESDHLWAILTRTGTRVFSANQFIAPVTSTRRTSSYGSRRVYQYADGKSDTTIHAGIDYGVPTGTEVRACAAGRVVLARERIVTGNTVILEHLPGLYSLYYHMDSIVVSENTIVEAETPLGESGSTGLATGPHLHWEIRVSGENADPDAFLSRPVLDKNDIINKLGKETGE
ncbi:MAG: M23 family metallopeptidase [Treponema sp.]|nr:M23 family metallopeptidase [Treponema sp.]